MIGYERAKELVVAAAGEDDCAREFASAVSRVTAIDAEGSRLTIAEALRIYRIKAWSAARAGVDVLGVDRTLERLAQRGEDEGVLLFLFEGLSRRYFLFLSEVDETLIGCMSLPQRVADPDVDWSTGVPVYRKEEE